MNECEGYIHDKEHPDMLEVMRYCNHCKRAYAGEDRDYNSDYYESGVNQNEQSTRYDCRNAER